ncbi:MAG: GNAT family N-acetyltransferase [Spirochaetota bacterium]
MNMFRMRFGQELFSLLRPGPDTEKGKAIQGQCQTHPEWVLVCEENRKIAGFVTFTLDNKKKAGEICMNAVDPDLGLNGIGQQMYGAVIELFRKDCTTRRYRPDLMTRMRQHDGHMNAPGSLSRMRISLIT